MSRTLRRGLSDEIGSWKIICMRVRACAHVVAAHLGQLPAFEHHRAAGGTGQLHDRPAGRALAAAGLADDAERLATQDIETDAADRVDLEAGVADGKLDHEVVDAQQHVGASRAGVPCRYPPSGRYLCLGQCRCLSLSPRLGLVVLG